MIKRHFKTNLKDNFVFFVSLFYDVIISCLQTKIRVEARARDAGSGAAGIGELEASARFQVVGTCRYTAQASGRENGV